MAWSEHIHVHVHNDDSEKIIKLLKEIKGLLTVNDDKQIFIELKNKLKASREKLVASFGENIKES